MGFFSDLWFDISDVFTTSDVEAQRNAYKKAVAALDKAIPKLDESINQLIADIDSIKKTLGTSADSSSGGLVDLYKSKYSIVLNDLNSILSYYQGKKDEVVGKRSEAQVQLDIYEQLVEEENRRKQEIAAQEAAAAAAAATKASNSVKPTKSSNKK